MRIDLSNHETVPTVCPFCHRPVDGTLSTRAFFDQPPRAGDLSICILCTRVSVYRGEGATLRLTKMTEDEAMELIKDDRLVNRLAQARQAILRTQAETLFKDDPNDGSGT